MHIVILQRRNLPIFLGGQATQDRGPRMHDQCIDAHRRDRVDEGGKELIIVAVIDADTAFHGDRHCVRIPQGRARSPPPMPASA